MDILLLLKKRVSRLTIACLVAGLFLNQTILGKTTPVPVIHVTDLYSPSQDPDDHWDLASQYALAYEGKIELKGIVIDYTRDSTLAGKVKNGGDPDLEAVAQMNHITELSIPVVIGSRGRIQTTDLLADIATRKDLGAVKFIQKVLRESEEPVVIHVTGTARDVALAGHSAPELFAAKCKAIYLNAGLSRNDGRSGEYNTGLDKIGYAAIFDIPCPIYWMPCFSAGSKWHFAPERRDELYGDRFNDIIPFETYWKFKHAEVFPVLSENMKRFFTYMYRNYHEYKKDPADPFFLRYLLKDTEYDIIDELNPTVRNMWCTAGFLHAAGFCVDKKGEIKPLAEAGDDTWYRFVPARISCDEDGATSWSLDADARERFIFRYFDWDQYNQSMNQGFKALLSILP